MSVSVQTHSGTLPSQLYEVATALQAAELAYNADPLNTSSPLFAALNSAAIDVDFEAKTVSVTATLPMEFSINASGNIVIGVTDYL